MEPRAAAGKPAVIAVVPNAAGRASIAQNAAAHGVVTSAAVAAAVAVNFYNNANIILQYYICQLLKLTQEQKGHRFPLYVLVDLV
jgi:acyl dehydratase